MNGIVSYLFACGRDGGRVCRVFLFQWVVFMFLRSCESLNFPAHFMQHLHFTWAFRPHQSNSNPGRSHLCDSIWGLGIHRHCSLRQLFTWDARFKIIISIFWDCSDCFIYLHSRFKQEFCTFLFLIKIEISKSDDLD